VEIKIDFREIRWVDVHLILMTSVEDQRRCVVERLINFVFA
jgi:hypothetical protein